MSLYIDDGYTIGDQYVNSGIYVEWGTRTIYVPRQYGTLVQTTPKEIRQLDIATLWQDLVDLEDTVDGMPFPDTHRNIEPITVGGVTLARVVEIINDYEVLFEDGQYTVQLIGANSNVADRTIQNQVSVTTSNSAGLVEVGGGSDPGTIAEAVWDAAGVAHTIDGSTGEILQFIRKLLANKVTISPDDSVTTIYDDDKVTPIHVFDHADVRNRDPQ